MTNQSELKQIATQVIGGVASTILMNRILLVLDESPDAKTAAVKVEKLVALFLGTDHARTLSQSFRTVLG